MTLELRGVTKRVVDGPETIVVLAEVTLQVAAGTAVAVLGRPGSGKSTLARIAAGRLAPDAGSVQVGGVDPYRLSRRRRARFLRRTVGYLPADPHLDPLLTGAENVALALELAGCSRRRARRRAGEVLDGLDAGHLAGRLPPAMRRTERARVALARALAADPSLVVADDPATGLADEAARAFVEALVGVATQGPAVLLATHDPVLATAADAVALLRHGSLEPEPHRPGVPVPPAPTAPTSTELTSTELTSTEAVS